MDKLRAEYQALETQKKELTATYKNYEKEVQDLKRKQENLDRFLGRTQTDPVQEQQAKKKITAYKTIGENAIPSDSTLPLRINSVLHPAILLAFSVTARWSKLLWAVSSKVGSKTGFGYY